jgi:hypothetical protein
MFTWRRWWLLFTVMWLVVAALQAATLYFFSPDERDKVWRPVLFGIGVPAVLYLIGLLWERFTSREQPPKEK